MAVVRVVALGGAGIVISGMVVFAPVIFPGAFGAGAWIATLAGGATIGAGVFATFGALGTGAATRAGAGTRGVMLVGPGVATCRRALGNVGLLGGRASGVAVDPAVTTRRLWVAAGRVGGGIGAPRDTAARASPGSGSGAPDAT